MVIVVVVIILFLIFVFARKLKKFNFACVTLISGAVKSGKTTFGVMQSIKKYKRNLFIWKIKRFFGFKVEKPLFYSNCPIITDNFVYCSADLLLRKKRFAYKSVVYLQEVSLIADSLLYKNVVVSDNLSEFVKLFGHETHGGYLFFDTQSLLDCHYSFKRCITKYIYIDYTKKVPLLPIVIQYVQERVYMNESGAVQIVEQDVTDYNKRIFYLFSNPWKKFDAYAYSYLTDNLEVANKIVPRKELKKDLKARYIIDLKKGSDKNVRK